MFYPDIVLRNRNYFGVFWLAAHAPKYLKKVDFLRADILVSSENLMAILNNKKDNRHNVIKLSLRCSSHMIFGMIVVAKKQYEYLMEDVKRLFVLLGKPTNPLDLPRQKGRKRRINLDEQDEVSDATKMQNVIEVIEQVAVNSLPRGFSDNFYFTQPITEFANNAEDAPPRDGRFLTLPEAEERLVPEDLQMMDIEPQEGFMTDGEIDEFLKERREGVEVTVGVAIAALNAEVNTMVKQRFVEVAHLEVDPPDFASELAGNLEQQDMTTKRKSPIEPTEYPDLTPVHQTPSKKRKGNRVVIPVVTVTTPEREIIPPRKRRRPHPVVREWAKTPRNINNDQMEANFRNPEASTIENCANPKWQKVIKIERPLTHFGMIDHPVQPDSKNIINIVRQKLIPLRKLHPDDFKFLKDEDSGDSSQSSSDGPVAQSTPIRGLCTVVTPPHLPDCREVNVIPNAVENIRNPGISERAPAEEATLSLSPYDNVPNEVVDPVLPLEMEPPVVSYDLREDQLSNKPSSSSVGGCEPTGCSLTSFMELESLTLQSSDFEATKAKLREAIMNSETASTTFKTICPPATTTRRRAAKILCDILNLYKIFELDQQEAFGDITIRLNHRE